LAGQTVSTISTNVTNAFKEPFPLDDMIRITFVTGAGKLGRQKYDENAAKAVTSALRDLGFEDDRGASCVKECAGSFKLQHDTGKNLKTVVVFPKIAGSGGSGTGGEGGGSSSGGGGAGVSVVPPGSPEEMIAMSSKTVFQSMLKSRCPAWSQKKGCLNALTDIKTVLTGLEQKLMSGTALSDSEQAFFDSVSASALDEKQVHVKDQMAQQVDGGAITPKEKSLLLGQVNEKLSSMQEDIDTAEKEDKPKKVEKLKGLLEKLVARKEKLASISTKGPHRLKHEAEITKLRTELEPLVELEEGAKGRLLSLKETQSLARKDDILAEIEELEVRWKRSSHLDQKTI
jgi:hypothetical protein